MVRRWRSWFLEGWQNVHDDERSGSPVTATDNAAVAVVRNVVEADCRVTIDEIIIRLPPGIEIRRSSIGTIMSDVLDFRKVCARWVARLLLENHKQQRMEAARVFLEMHQRDGDQLFSRIVTGDESWVHHSTPETKRQSMVWKKPEESAPKKAKVTISAGKVMAMENFKWEIFTHPPHSPELAPSDFHLYPALKWHLGGKHFANDDEVQAEANNWLLRQDTAWYNSESERLYQEYNLSGNTETADNLIRSLDDSRKHRWHTMLEQMDFSKSINPGYIRTPQKKAGLKKVIGTNLSKSSTHPQLSTNIDLNEVEDAIKVTHNNRAPGPDGIMPEFMKHLGQKAIKWMAKLFTNILSTGSIPSVWKQAKVLAILKPGKTSDDPNNYRPISLLCIPYKILERIILNRISPIIEEYLPIEQAGFRPGRNCAEQTLALTTTIEDGFQKKLKTGAVFVDLTAAYDTVWREGLLYKLSKIINCKNIIKLINNFLTNRKITVHLNNKKSRPRTLNNGLPQGSVLAPLLFNVYTSDIPTTNSQNFLYADDIALLHQEQSFSTLEQILNEDLKKLENFFSKWHLIPNPSKTVSSVFHLNNHKANRPLKLTFCNKPLSHDPCPKYLGVTLDRSLTFRQHLEKTIDKLKTRNNIMTRLAGTTWGCGADTLRTTALALVYSVAEYCAPVWERSSHTDSIDAQLNQTMRLITGNMRPTPIDWLPYLSNIAPPDLRRKKSTSNLLSKIKANTKLPINTVLEIPPPTRLISRNPAWVADENVDLKEEWRNRWSNLAIANKDLVEDPNTKPPGYNLPRRTWSSLNRIRTSTGRCNYLLNKWNMSPDQNCDCGQIQTMHHILRDCPRRFFQGTLGDIHRCTEEALEWIRHLDIPL
ncbi:hypothetical protein LAZ67_1001022 [Cordylochernes scorpioides]|uniref:Reverse transcriptase domain-containing protein n=1 Tax=Cordylochernes scorpioides TaxID=51811 RepID=A0ABY6JZR3_9ARAC|nr:hypothetical protein LAZ67_1001022 [Cordylochernes scorpioides]